jgi:hypothetical protein
MDEETMHLACEAFLLIHEVPFEREGRGILSAAVAAQYLPQSGRELCEQIRRHHPRLANLSDDEIKYATTGPDSKARRHTVAAKLWA